MTLRNLCTGLTLAAVLLSSGCCCSRRCWRPCWRARCDSCCASPAPVCCGPGCGGETAYFHDPEPALAPIPQ
jgi:hypothetical protein